jgi:hypothetical protein
LQPGLTHEVVVWKGGAFTFYRNGKRVIEVASPRAVTECDGDVVLLGDPSVALASVNFYARALQPNEVVEMYVGGQPLSELATGSVLPQVEIKVEDQVMQTVRSSAGKTEEVIDIVQDQTLYNTVLSMSRVREGLTLDVDNPILHPSDTADATVFPGTASQGDLLSEYGKKVWEAGGRKTSAWEEARRGRTWRNDGTHNFWPMMQGPIFMAKDSNISTDLSAMTIPTDSQGLTLNFWCQQLEVNRSDAISVFVYSASCGQCSTWSHSHPCVAAQNCKDPTCPDDCAQFRLSTYGSWMKVCITQIKTGSASWIGDNPGNFAVARQ